MTRVILIDPDEASRFEIVRTLGGLGSVWISEVVSHYEGVTNSVPESIAEIALVVVDANLDQAINVIRELRVSCPKLIVVAASRSTAGETILKSIRAGAVEFVPLPLDLDEFKQVIERISPRVESRVEGAKIITVTGAAGGVGCTTLAVNLAVAMAHRPGCSVALADFDLLLGIVDSSLDLIPEHSLLDIALQIDRLDLMLLRRSLSTHSSGLHVLPCPPRMEDAARIDPEALRRVIELMRQAFNVVVIDTGKGFSATDFTAMEMADTILLVVQLELNCLRNSARYLQLLRQCGDLADKVHVVANRIGSLASAIGPKKAEQTLGLPISWQVPNAANVICAARSKGVPLEVEASGCRAHRAFQDIAGDLAGPTSQPTAVKTSKLKLSRITALFS